MYNFPIMVLSQVGIYWLNRYNQHIMLIIMLTWCGHLGCCTWYRVSSATIKNVFISILTMYLLPETLLYHQVRVHVYQLFPEENNRSPVDSPYNGPVIHKPFPSQIAKFMGPTWGPSGADRTQVGPMLAPWTLLSRMPWCNHAMKSMDCPSFEHPPPYIQFTLLWMLMDRCLSANIIMPPVSQLISEWPALCEEIIKQDLWLT